jgi:RimJ/RimL family protein N-acetyltransferase
MPPASSTVSAPEHGALLTPRLMLRPLSLADTDAMHTLFSDPQTMKYWSHPAHASREETVAAMSKATADDQTTRTWAVTFDGGHCHGWVALFGVQQGMGWVGYILSPTLRGKGLAEEAMQAVLNYGFGAWGLHRLSANIDPRNHRSASLLRRLGFVQEGFQRQDFLYDGQYVDTGIFGLLASDWRALRNGTKPPFLPPSLTHGPTILRPLRMSDADALHPAFADPESMRYMPYGPHATMDQTREKIAGIVSGQHGGLHWAITADGETCLGWASLLREAPGQFSAGYMTIPTARGQGLAKAALAALLRYGFVERGKIRIIAEIEPDNRASIRTVEALGFRLEGVHRHAGMHDGQPRDLGIHAILIAEWHRRHELAPS